MSSLTNLIKLLMPKSFFNYLKMRDNLNSEILYSSIFRDTIEDSEWLYNKSFSLHAGAAGYSFMYILYRILDEVQPKHVLELGLGQTTKLTSQYAKYFKNSKIITVESDQDWIDVFSQKLDLTDNIQIIQKGIETFSYGGTENLRYKDFTNGISDEKFDLILIDGPHGFFQGTGKFLEYSRSNIWELIPNNLAEDFIIIIDDYERKGEHNTMEVVKSLLEKENINYYTLTIGGINQQCIITSEKYKFVTWY